MTRDVLSTLCGVSAFGALLGWAGLASAVECTPMPEGPGPCAPVNTQASFWVDQSHAGLLLKWEFFDETPPDTVRVYRQPPMNAAGYVEVRGDALSWFDPAVTPGRLYSYQVCMMYDAPGCSPWVSQGVPSDGGGGTAPPVAPHDLKARDASGWATATRWQQRIALSWTPGSGYETSTLNTGNVLGVVNDLAAAASSYVFSDGVGWSDPFVFRACGAKGQKGIYIGPNGAPLCSNSVNFTSGHRPLPKAPVGLGASALSRNRIDVQFSSGDENVSAWFDVQRLNGPDDTWLTLAPRVAMGSPGLVVDDGSRVAAGFDNPFVYRVCAGNEAGVTCSGRFAATVASVPLVRSFRLVGLAGKCMDAQSDGLSAPNGTPVNLYACMNGFDGRPLSVQVWSRGQGPALPIGGVGGKCLDVTGGNPASGTPVELWDCNGGPNQAWTPAPDGSVRGLAGKCLDVSGGNPADGTRLILWDCTGAPNQRWQLDFLSP